MFDLQDYRRAHAPWVFTTTQGRGFVARPVSADQVEALLRAELVAAEPDAPRGAHRAAARARRVLLRRMFPWRLSYVFRGDPVRIILALEPPAQRAVLLSFFDFLGVKIGPSNAPATDGTT